MKSRIVQGHSGLFFHKKIISVLLHQDGILNYMFFNVDIFIGFGGRHANPITFLVFSEKDRYTRTVNIKKNLKVLKKQVLNLNMNNTF